MSQETLIIRVAGEPKPKGSMRAFVAGKRAIMTHDNTKTKPWQSLLSLGAASAMQEQSIGIFEAPLYVRLAFFLPRPKSATRKRRPWPSVKPDIDKLARCALDAFTGVVWRDDAQVVGLEVSKEYADSEAPGMRALVRERDG